jgi:hypothetical protein
LTVTAQMLEKVDEAWRLYRESIERFCASRQVAYFTAPVDIPFEDLVLQVFRRGGFLR